MTASKYILSLALFASCSLFPAAAWGEIDSLLVEEVASADADSVEFVASEENSFATDNFTGYSAWEDAIYSAAINAQGEAAAANDDEANQPVLVPEPSSFALLAGLASLLLAMTLLRWHFDRSTTTAVVR